jgi:hypothetical protein
MAMKMLLSKFSELQLEIAFNPSGEKNIMPRWTKAASESDAMFGFVAGILVMDALFVWLLTDTIWAVPLLLFAMGMIMAFDTLFPYGRQLFAISWTGGIIAGCFAVLFANAYGFLYWSEGRADNQSF